MTTTDTVVDAVTGLMWQRVVNATTYTWANAKTYCDNLTLASYSDWRLPTVIELESIVDLSVYNPSINATAFPSTPSTWFWSSSPAAHNSSSAWLVHFDYGSSDPFNNIANPYRVRCVR